MAKKYKEKDKYKVGDEIMHNYTKLKDALE